MIASQWKRLVAVAVACAFLLLATGAWAQGGAAAKKPTFGVEQVIAKMMSSPGGRN